MKSVHTSILLNKVQSGFALLPVAVALIVVASIVLLINYQGATSVNRVASDVEANQAHYIAEAGLQHALWQARNSKCTGDFSIPSTALGSDSYSATSTGGGTTTAYTLAVDQDAWIRSDNPTTNNGSNADLHIRFESGNIEQPLVRFDLSSLPANAQINSASLWFYIETGKEHPEGHITLHRVTTDWIESDVTWDSFNGSYDATALGMISAQAVSDVWVQVNITSQVQAWVNGESNYGFLLNSTSEGVHGEYISSEGASGKQPRLEVVVGNGSASPIDIQVTGTLANGNTRTLDRATMPAYQPHSTTILQLGTDSGEDAMLDSFYSARNYGSSDYMQIHDNGSDWTQYPIIRFDLSRLPQSASVRSARLELHMKSLNAPGTATVHQVTRNWVEGTKSGGGQPDGATWFTHDGTNNWATAGGDYNATAVTETAINIGDTWVTWEITSVVKSWFDGQPNYGVLIKPDSSLKQARFYSKEETNMTFHPKLTIEYACECGKACDSPQGLGDLLLVVGDDNPIDMAPSDAKLRDILESWGYSVTLLQDNVSQTAYDSAVAINDVVYISETASSASVGTKLTNAPIGVVNEQGNLNDELGMASGKANPIGSSVNIVDNSHYITYPFQSGSLEIFSKDMEGLTISGTEAPDLQTLADWSGTGSLVVLDKGMQTTSGGTTAGRRVMLPLGRSTNSNFNWDYLNNNGRLLVQRSLQWGTGSLFTPTINLLMVVVNPDNLTTQEAAKKTLLESWDYTVNLIDESDNQTAFDDAVAVNKVVFITEDVTASTINTKLVNATIGVVTEEANLADEFGFSETIFWGSGTTIKTEGTHYIVEPLPAGIITILTTSESLAGLTGARAPDIEIVAESPAGIGPATLDSGAALINGGVSAGRRVFLPWGGNDMNVNHLSADGLTVFKRSLEWAAGMGMDESNGTYLDEFNAIAYSGNDGTQDWSNDWQELGESNGPTSGKVRVVASVSSCSNGNCLRIGGVDSDITGSAASREADLSSATTATLSFTVARTSSGGGSATVAVEISSDGGTTWTELDNYSLVTGTPETPTLQTFDISAYIAANTQIRFIGNERLDDASYIYIDDVLIELDGTVPEGPPGYLDEFNLRNCAADDYAGSDGSMDWTATPWTEVGESDGSCAGLIQVAEDSDMPETGSYRLMLDERLQNVVRIADLSAFSSAVLSFDYRRYNYPTTSDYFSVLVSRDGSIWSELERFTGIATDVSYQTVSYDISPYIADTTHIAFATKGINTIQTVYIDNVKITESGGGGKTPVDPVIGDSQICFADDFESGDYTGNTGSMNWSTNWVEFGDDNNSSSGDERVQSESGDMALRVRDNDNGGEGVYRDIDLSGFTAAMLSLEYRRHNLDTENDWVAVQVSSDGGSNWAELGHFAGPGTDDTYQTFSHAIVTPLTANSRLRLITSSTMGGQDVIYFDNIEIICSQVVNPTF